MDKLNDMQEIYKQLIEQWELYIGDCYQGTDSYFLWINQGELCLEEPEVEYIVKHKIPMIYFVRYWDYMMGEFGKNWDSMAVNNSPKLNFKQWYETICLPNR